jgi:hypothetical protein
MTASADHAPYWRALRYYTKPWRDRHGADMVALMLDASDNGEDPLSGRSRRSLMWSGIRQRFASPPYVWLWVAATVASLGLHAWTSRRNIQFRDAAERRQTSQIEPALLTLTIGTAALFVACLTILTVSLLHRPAFPQAVATTGVRSWPGWIAFAVGTLSWVAFPLTATSLVYGVRRYRTAGGTDVRLLATLSAVVLGLQLLVIVPVITLMFFL